MAKVRDFRNFRSGPIENALLVDVKVGQTVGFKSDTEQYGKVVAINGDRLTLRNENGFSGDYLRYAKETVEHALDCWVG